MASEESKTVLKGRFYFAELGIKKNESCPSGVFKCPHSTVSFYLQLNLKAKLSLHLATCPQEKLHIDKFEVKAYKGSAEKLYRFEVNGDVYLDGTTEVNCKLGELKNWDIKCTITYKEPLDDLVSQSDHQQRLIDDLVISRLIPEHTDFTLVADGKEHSVHKFILSIRSPVFAAMFRHEEFEENEENRMEIEDVSAGAMMAFLDYIYSGDVSKVNQFAGELFELADKYQVPLLAKACSSALSIDNAAQLYYQADLHDNENLKKKVMHFIRLNKEAVMKTNGWNEFVGTNPNLLSQLIVAFL